MKSRYKKHLNRIEKRSPLVAFSKEDILKRNDILGSNNLDQFNQHMGLERKSIYSKNYKAIKNEMEANLIMFTDNYLMCGGHQYVYLLLPIGNGKFKITEKESISEWSEAYWKKEDPNSQREWAYIDEDINDLYDFIYSKFKKHNKAI